MRASVDANLISSSSITVVSSKIVPEGRPIVARRFIAGLCEIEVARPGGTDETLSSMANTYTSLNIHYVFSTKNRAPLIVGDLRERLWSFMGGIAREME